MEDGAAARSAQSAPDPVSGGGPDCAPACCCLATAGAARTTRTGRLHRRSFRVPTTAGAARLSGAGRRVEVAADTVALSDLLSDVANQETRRWSNRRWAAWMSNQGRRYKRLIVDVDARDGVHARSASWVESGEILGGTLRPGAVGSARRGAGGVRWSSACAGGASRCCCARTAAMPSAGRSPRERRVSCHDPRYQADSSEHPRRLVLVVERPTVLFVVHLRLIANLRHERYSGVRLLWLYRIRARPRRTSGS